MLSLYDLYTTFNKPSVGSPKDQYASNAFALACHVIRTLPNDMEENQYTIRYIIDALDAVNHTNPDLDTVGEYYRLAKRDPLAAISVVQPDGFILDNVIRLDPDEKEYMRGVFNTVYGLQLEKEKQYMDQ